jgi:hypothetical protein
MELCLQQQQTVNLYPTGGHLNFSTCYTKNVLLEQKMIKSLNKCYFVENKTDIMQHVFSHTLATLRHKSSGPTSDRIFTRISTGRSFTDVSLPAIIDAICT